jgi:adenylate cyclase
MVTMPDSTAKESVAVLPFDDLSPGPGTDYFSDGISEEIINTLSHVSWLHVTARNSSLAFRGEAVDLAESVRSSTWRRWFEAAYNRLAITFGSRCS